MTAFTKNVYHSDCFTFLKRSEDKIKIPKSVSKFLFCNCASFLKKISCPNTVNIDVYICTIQTFIAYCDLDLWHMAFGCVKLSSSSSIKKFERRK